MASKKTVRIPDLGDFEQVDVVEVHIAPDDSVAQDDSLITLESDKAAMDVPSPYTGRITSVLVQKGDKVSEGDDLCEMEVEAGEAPADPEEEGTEESEGQSEQSEQKTEAGKNKHEKPEEAPPHTSQREEGPPIHASPGTRRLARERGIDLRSLSGSGRKGRITKEDVQQAAQQREREPPPRPGATLDQVSELGEAHETELTPIQRRGAQRLAESWPKVPQVTQHEHADITDLEAFRKELAPEAERRGVKLTPLAFVMKAVVAALQRFPRFNSSLAEGWESIIEKSFYHLSIAVDTDQGLVVPVVRDVDRKGAFELAAELDEKASKAREGRLEFADVKGGGFSITNLGGIGGTYFSPLVTPPQVAVLGLSQARMQPVWQPDQQQFEPRRVLPVSLSYDHRVIDGAAAARFVVYLAEVLADVRRLML